MKKIPLMSEEIKRLKAKKKIKKRKPLVSGEKFYFIAHTDFLTAKNGKSENHVDLNFDDSFLVVHDAESYDPSFDASKNCFRTKAEANKAINEIRKLLKYRG